MDKYYVMVVGSGQSTRQNLEALMEDHYYANGAGGTLVLPFNDKPSNAQIFAAQYAKDKNIKVVGVSSTPPTSESFFNAVSLVDNPIEYAVSIMKGSPATSFILWNDDDPESLEALARSSAEGIPSFDLTAGLSPITAPGNIKVEEKPKFPAQETIPAPVVEEVEEEDDAELEDEDEELEEDEDEEEVEEQTMDDLYFGVKAFAKLIAKEVARELLEAQQKPSEGSEA